MFDGRKEAGKILVSLKKKIEKLDKQPGLAAILVGSDEASKIYVGLKEKRTEEIGAYFDKYFLAENTSEAKIIELINKLNKDRKIDGILVQLPLPAKFNTERVIQTIDPAKDVDGFFFCQRKKGIRSPLIETILYFMKLSCRDWDGKRAVVVCNSHEFAEGVQLVLEQKRIKTDILISPREKKDLRRYDLVVVALGQKHWLSPEMVKKDSVLIDVGINRRKGSKKIYGDIDPKCANKTAYLTPVPGGVGPLTVASLMSNLVKLASKK